MTISNCAKTGGIKRGTSELHRHDWKLDHNCRLYIESMQPIPPTGNLPGADWPGQDMVKTAEPAQAVKGDG
jgi:hypothetical protein